MSKRLGLFAVLLLATAMLVLPASAVLNVISINGTVFQGESGLNVTLSAAGATNFAYFTDVTTGTATKTVAIGNASNFYVDPVQYSYEGFWYAMAGNTILPRGIYVEKPAITDIKIIDNRTQKIINDGKALRSDALSFRLDTNLLKISNRTGYVPADGFLTIRVKDSTGAIFTRLVDLTGSQVQINLLPQVTAPGGSITDTLWYYPAQGVAAWNLGARTTAGSYIYKTGTYEVYIEVDSTGPLQNLWYNWGGAVTGITASPHRTVTVADDTVSLSISTDSVVRGNDFSVVVDGRSNWPYYLWITGSSATDIAPTIKGGQAGVAVGDNAARIYAFEAGTSIGDDTNNNQNLYARIGTNDAGKRTIGFQTTQDTDDKTYTIRVQDSREITVIPAIYDTIKVKVSKGAVTVDAEGTKVYYIGQEITFMGENTDSEIVYLFITGPNVGRGDCGAQMNHPTVDVCDYYTTCFDVRKDVKADDTWEYKWNTATSGLDAGTYTIYAVSGPQSKCNLSPVEYDTVSIQLKKPFVNASLSATRVAKGDDIFVRGTAEGDPSQGIQLWILGINRFSVATESVADDTTFEYKLEGSVLDGWSSGQYFVVVQHPMYNDRLDVEAWQADANGVFACPGECYNPVTSTQCVAYATCDPIQINKTESCCNLSNPLNFAGANLALGEVCCNRTSTTTIDQIVGCPDGASACAFNNVKQVVEFNLEGPRSLMGSDAADALVKVLDQPNIDDTYAKLYFMLEEPKITIEAISDKVIGDTFTISGTTNLAADDTFLVSVTSASFRPTEKTQAGEFSGVSGQTTVVKGTGVENTWSYDVDTSTFKPDQYLVKVECVETGTTATANFFVSEVPATVVTTPPPATTVVTTVPPTATTTTVPVATTTPGFGAVIALIGLGAVAVLVLRRH